MADPDPDPASEGIWTPRSSHWTWRRCQGRNHSCSSSHLHPLSLLFKEKPIMELPCSFSLDLCPLSCFSRALLVHPSLDTLWIMSLCPHTGRVGAAPPYPLCSPCRAQRGMWCLRTRFSSIPGFLALPALPFSFAPADWLCGRSLVDLRICSGALGGFLIGRAMDS